MLLDAPTLRRRFLLLAATTGFLLLGARLAFCSSTRRRDDDATTTQRRRDGSTRGAGGGPLQPIASSATVLGPRSLGGYRVLTRRARELPRGVTSHSKDTGKSHVLVCPIIARGAFVVGKEESGRPPEQARAPGRPFVCRAARVESSTGGNFPWRSAGSKTTGEERREEGQAHSSAIQLVHSILVYEVCEGAPPIVEVEWWRRTSHEELTVESEAVTGREP